MQVVQIVLLYLDSGCSKHMTRDRSRLRNFMKKFIGTVLAAADSPPTRSDEQILPRNKWVPVGKSNCFLDV
ncbi:hypothetical protein Tco_0325267, partial [Tanacetum coccineum]